MKIEKKTHPKSFQAILDGRKNFEIRLADWDCEEGDVLVLREYDPKKADYTGRVVEKKVTWVSKINDLTYWPREEIEEHGIQVISLK